MFRRVEIKRPFWFYICGFNMANLSGLFAFLFRLLLYASRLQGVLLRLAEKRLPAPGLGRFRG